MKKGSGKGLGRLVALALGCLLFSALSGCASKNESNAVYCNIDAYTPYPEAVAELLPAHRVRLEENIVFAYLEAGAASEAFDVQALPALEKGVARYWYPHYLATVVIAVDRDRTDAAIGGWLDLPAANAAVGIADGYADRQMIFTAIAYGLEGEGPFFGRATALLEELWARGHLVTKSFEPPVLICYDHQAAAMIKAGRNIEVVVPGEGTLTYERGLLSNHRLSFAGDVEARLLSAGLRLVSGQCDAALYPDASAYKNAERVADYSRFGALSQDASRAFRRGVLHTRRYATADEREHQFAVMLYIILVVVWVASVINRAMQKGVRRAALLTGLILLGWIILRLVKYQTGEADTLNRYLWYGFYLFQLTLPLVLLWLAWMIDRPEAHPLAPGWLYAHAAANALLIALVFTNDLHGLVFRLDLSAPDWSDNYGYGAGYYIELAACVLPLLAALFLLLYKSGRNPRKKRYVYPLAFVLLLCAYGYGYITGVPIARESDFTMMVGLFTLLFLGAAMRTGLVPVNTKYATLFAYSTLGMQIVDEGGEAVLSAAATEYGADALARALAACPQPVQQDEDTLLYAAKIPGGYGVWQEDIAGLNRLHAQVEESVRRLAAANAVLAEEEKLKRAIGEENAKTQLMAQLENEIAGHVEELARRIEDLALAPDPAREAACIAVLLCYVKRRCNLFFRERETRALPANELAVYMDELAEIASYTGVKIIFTCELAAPLPVRRATLLYDCFFQTIDWAAKQGCPTMLAHLGTEGEAVVLRLLPSADAAAFTPAPGLAGAIAAAGGIFQHKDLDDAVGVSLTFPEGGEDIG